MLMFHFAFEECCFCAQLCIISLNIHKSAAGRRIEWVVLMHVLIVCSLLASCCWRAWDVRMGPCFRINIKAQLSKVRTRHLPPPFQQTDTSLNRSILSTTIPRTMTELPLLSRLASSLISVWPLAKSLQKRQTIFHKMSHKIVFPFSF